MDIVRDAISSYYLLMRSVACESLVICNIKIELIGGLAKQFTTIQESIKDINSSITDVKKEVKSMNDNLVLQK